MILAFKNSRARTPGGLAVDSSGIDPTNTVLAFRKTTDADLGIYCPVKLKFTDGDDPGPQNPANFDVAYATTPLVYALSPSGGDEAEAVGISLAEIPAGRFGPVAVSGLVICTVDVTDTAHVFATLTSSSTKLLSGDGGPVRILWKTTDTTGEQVCVVLLNAGSGSLTVAGGFLDNVHVVQDIVDGSPVGGPYFEKVEFAGTPPVWPPVISDPRVTYGLTGEGADGWTAFESENRLFRLIDSRVDGVSGVITHVEPCFDGGDNAAYIVFWTTNTSITEDIYTYAWDVDTCVMTTTVTNYTILLQVQSPGDNSTGLVLTRGVTPPPPP
jgi:hypothetical protein